MTIGVPCDRSCPANADDSVARYLTHAAGLEAGTAPHQQASSRVSCLPAYYRCFSPLMRANRCGKLIQAHSPSEGSNKPTFLRTSHIMKLDHPPCLRSLVFQTCSLATTKRRQWLPFLRDQAFIRVTRAAAGSWHLDGSRPTRGWLEFRAV